MLQWNDMYKTGEDKVDEQHKVLFQKVNDLELKLGQGAGLEVANEILGFLALYVKSHFVYEEMCMHRLSCPAAANNKDAHQKFLTAFTAFQDRAKKEGMSEKLLRELHSTAENWLKNHIIRVDTQLRQCAKK